MPNECSNTSVEPTATQKKATSCRMYHVRRRVQPRRSFSHTWNVCALRTQDLSGAENCMNLGTYYRWLLHSVFIEGRTTLWCFNQMTEHGDSPTTTIHAENARIRGLFKHGARTAWKFRSSMQSRRSILRLENTQEVRQIHGLPRSQRHRLTRASYATPARVYGNPCPDQRPSFRCTSCTQGHGCFHPRRVRRTQLFPDRTLILERRRGRCIASELHRYSTTRSLEGISEIPSTWSTSMCTLSGALSHESCVWVFS